MAVVVGAAAVTTGYIYTRDKEPAPQTATGTPSAPDQAATTQTGEAQSEDAAAPESTGVAPTFDVVGIEPGGETVVAGRSEPGAIVALLANGEVVGKGVANAEGEWTIILDTPLPAGDYDIALRAESADGMLLADSEQRLTVSLPEGGRDRPLIVLNAPDAASTVLQAPEVEVAAAETAPETALAGAQPAPAETAAGTQPASPAAVETAAGPEPETSASPTGEVPAGEASGETATAQAPAGQPEPAAETGAGPTPQPDAAAPAAVAEAEVRPTAPDAPVDGPADTAPQPATTVAEDAGTAAAQNGLAVTVEAVESENGTLYVAGRAEPNATVRVYVDGAHVGDAVANDTGRWLLQGERQVEAGEVEVRVDQVESTAASVVARAAVTFEKGADAVVLTRVSAEGTAGGPTGASGEAGSRALPNVIIRKGDNLWNISRRLYGEGMRYTTIYQANKGQIRNPDLIYPGQVFLTPEGDLGWTPEPGTN
ncbi:LysM domain protein [Polymorphum gilvum SL003B-26A1]|uniref:LysM domain protein n=1 Tax=Polymorphum gilvum (strain LMG 25793 / CGMCC 1.9160 / SL003B-26A1) TaxID=991905 RepID=F2J597_POLGS|nr:LysM domain protein [Polymorphum gilvum SL003B-26A1]